MTREQFLSRLRRFCRKTDRSFDVNKRQGKGAHYIVYVDDRKTTVQSGELTPQHVRTLLKQLDLPLDVLQ